MSKCTAAQAVSASAYWVGYKEKASISYSQSRDKSCFTANAGSGNYSYPGFLCGCNGQSWCAAFVSTVLYEAAGSDKTAAKEMMHGVWPYINVVQVYDACTNSSYKGRAKSWGGTWQPKVGDIVIFDWEHNNSRDHTGLCVAVTSTSITVREGNSSQMVKDNTYPLSSNYLWGYVRPLYADATSVGTVSGSESYGDAVTVSLNELSYGNTGSQVKTLQRVLYSYYGSAIEVDGDFGSTTKSYLMKLQKELGVTADGVCGKNTWTAILTKLG